MSDPTTHPEYAEMIDTLSPSQRRWYLTEMRAWRERAEAAERRLAELAATEDDDGK